MVTEKAEMRFFLEAGELWGWDSICLLLFLVTAEMPPPQEGLAEGPVFSITECCRLLPRHGSPFVITHLLSHLLSTTEALWKGQAGSFSLYPQMHHQRAQICYCSVVSDSLWPHGLQQARFLCPSPTPGAYSNSCLLSRWCHPTISSSVAPFSSWLQSFLASGSFPMSQFFTSGSQSIGVSASVLAMNIQDWFPLGLASLTSLQSKGLLRVFSNTTVQKLQFFGALPSLWSSSHNHTWPLRRPQSWLYKHL